MSDNHDDRAMPRGPRVELSPAGEVQLVGEGGPAQELEVDPDAELDPEDAQKGMLGAHVVFSHEYLRDFDARRAAERTGYKPARGPALRRRADVDRLVRALVARRIRALGLSGDALVLRLWRLVDLGTTPQPVVDRVTGEVVRREDGSLAESLNPALASTAVKAATLLAKIMGEGAGPRPLPGLRTDEAAAGRRRALDALGGVLQKVRSIT